MNVIRRQLSLNQALVQEPRPYRTLWDEKVVARGGIEPPTRGFTGNVPIWVNAEVMNCERIILGGGNRSSKILMSPEGLLQVPNTEVIAHLGYLA